MQYQVVDTKGQIWCTGDHAKCLHVLTFAALPLGAGYWIRKVETS